MEISLRNISVITSYPGNKVQQQEDKTISGYFVICIAPFPQVTYLPLAADGSSLI